MLKWLRAFVKAILRTCRWAIEWMLQPSRLRRNIRVAGRCHARTILFVCHGNICRSPYAEYAARLIVATAAMNGVRIQSAGLFGPGRPSPPEAIRAAGERGIDLGPHRSRLLTAELVGQADLVFVMDASQRTRVCVEFGPPRGPILILGECDPQRGQPRTIRDPIGQAHPVFVETYERIDRCLGQVFQVMEWSRGAVASVRLRSAPEG